MLRLILKSITEMAEAGVPEAAMQSIAGHLSKKMLDHYSHVRMAAKRSAVESLGGGLIVTEPDDCASRPALSCKN